MTQSDQYEPPAAVATAGASSASSAKNAQPSSSGAPPPPSQEAPPPAGEPVPPPPPEQEEAQASKGEVLSLSHSLLPSLISNTGRKAKDDPRYQKYFKMKRLVSYNVIYCY